MHPRVLMRCLPTALCKNVAGWIREDPAITLDKFLNHLRSDFQFADGYSVVHHWVSLTLEDPVGKLTLAAWGTWKQESER